MFLENIANFIFNSNYDNASTETIAAVKAAFVDFYGVTYRGFREEPSKIAIKAFNEIDSLQDFSKLQCSLIGEKGLKLNILTASFINGISAHSLELDDGHRKAQVHLGAIVFPTALAISEAYDLSGKEFLEASIAGYELGIMLGQLVNPAHRNKGFHATGTIGAFVAGAVASKLLKLDKDQIRNVLGLCGTQAAGLLESDHSGSMGKPLHVGRAIKNGITSAFLAKNGFTGAQTIIDGKEGFLNAMVYDKSSFNKDDYTLENMLKNVGPVRLKDIYFKKYPFCRHLHSSIDTAMKLRATLGKEYNHIGNLLVKTYKIAAQHDNYAPRNIGELRQSLPYAVAIAIVFGDVSPNKLNELIKYGLFEPSSNVTMVNDVKNLVQKIHVQEVEDFEALYPDKRPSQIVVKLDDHFRNGVFQNITSVPRGDYENPYEFSELIDKFRSLNPTFDVSKLRIIDEIEHKTISSVMNELNG
ncbi:MAG: MmgE/PrpD family protein [archaeon]|nr:MmgE/PrpD family protein [archaeon]